jgi:hypothetical protein
MSGWRKRQIMKTFVSCRECGEEHETKEVEILNICESLYGEDLLQYVCPFNQHTTEAIVYGR